MSTAAAAQRWAETWKRAWELQDVEAIVALYHPDITFSTQPFREPHLRRAGVREYVSQAFTEEEEVRVWMGEAVVGVDRAAIEWWAALIENGLEITLAGTSVLRFDAEGLVIEQRDTWNQADGRRSPPEGWGR
jgi:SnoaL-like protein